ncbi:hypothetical protein HBI56_006260 [Parastagonospora nodorum]|nr:hypothetical protein HBH53_080260 [Parastagonospora nodorum]KAH3982827.1 hypothetical protein HBH51_038180 [Parastagonospora nodorum]KAH4005751.1 hypothetical protein HBI10_032420 [Parastagonospora nodorum]KAH4033135.1 hypothetical protein HBI13_006680 [Parastagonospora nodorum]KAH4041939.1 hypothetical protein HBI09_006580 [Parastagonospora nodorum]
MPAVQQLDWSGFPAPPPEAEGWKPDPDSIPRTGALKDPRFGKDPWEANKLQNARKQFGYHLHHSSEARRLASPSSASPASATLSMGQWPQQEPQQASQEDTPVATAHMITDMDLSVAHATSLAGTALTATASTGVKTETVGEALAAKLPPSSKTSKGAMETILTTPMPGTLPTEKSTFPPWAGAIEKALAEDTSRTSCLPSSTPSKSIPPHLRKKLSSNSPSLQQKIPIASEGRTVSLDNQFQAAMQASCHVSGSLKADTETDEHTSTNSSNIAETPVRSTNVRYRDHGHYMKIQLVLVMEMDLRKQELLQFNDRDLENRMMDLSSIHQECSSKGAKLAVVSSYAQRQIETSVWGVMWTRACYWAQWFKTGLPRRNMCLLRNSTGTTARSQLTSKYLAEAIISYKQSTYNLPHRQNIVKSGNNSEIETESHTESCNMIALQHQGVSNLEPSYGAYSDSPIESTKILHQGKDNMPAKTLTNYKDSALTRQSLLQLHSKVVPDHGESIVNCLEEFVTDRSAQLDNQDEDLIRDLGVHFEALKSEFEETTGRAWTPLRAWEKEDGEWDLVGEE